jgi:hypothetical protein
MHVAVTMRQSDEKSVASVPQISLKFQLDDEQLTD